MDRIDNPDRRARFAFVRPALSTDPLRSEAFFSRLADPSAREQERWVVEAVRFLHHPLRATHAQRFIDPSLELLEEIQRTGDIFFPSNWLDATLGGHRSVAAADTVRGFLQERGASYPERLRQKLLQSADLLFRASALPGES